MWVSIHGMRPSMKPKNMAHIVRWSRPMRARSPFPDHYFASGFSNSVLEHIPHIDAVLAETARVLKPGAPFVFCVPNDNFLPSLSIGGGFDRIGLHPMASWYRSFFNKISRHYHCDSPSVWQARLEQNGFTLERWWHYFSPQALHVLEWGHYFGAPTLIPHALFNRWIMVPTRWNLYFTERFLRKFMEMPEHPQGVYTFYIAHVSTGGDTAGSDIGGAAALHSRHPVVPRFQPGTRIPTNEYGRGVLPRPYSFVGQTTTGR